jgi:hypothetical protein
MNGLFTCLTLPSTSNSGFIDFFFIPAKREALCDAGAAIFSYPVTINHISTSGQSFFRSAT